MGVPVSEPGNGLPQPSIADLLTERKGDGTRRSSAMTASVVVVLALIAVPCVLASILAPYDPTALSSDRFAAPGVPHLFGTDELGRDLLSRILYGGRLTILIALGATLVAIVAGTLWGMLAAVTRGYVDEVLMRLADAAMAVPQLLFALVFVAAFGADPARLVLIVGILLTPTTARLVRSAALTELESEYAAAARAYGATTWDLLFHEVLPNLRGPVAVQTTINVANAVILEAALSFVGLGLQPPMASLGSLVQQGYRNMYQSTGYVLFPMVVIFVLIWMLNVLADQLGDRARSRR